jgi:hypothetical protein
MENDILHTAFIKIISFYITPELCRHTKDRILLHELMSIKTSNQNHNHLFAEILLDFKTKLFYEVLSKTTLHPNIKDIVLFLVHTILQWHKVGEKQSKFLMLGDIFSDPEHFNPRLKFQKNAFVNVACWLPWTFNLFQSNCFKDFY